VSRDDDHSGLRLNRFLARAGLGSRRAVEEIIFGGRVEVDGRVVDEPGFRVGADAVVTVAGRVIDLPSQWSVFAFYKPLGIVSTLKPQRGQRALGEFRERANLPPGVVPIGRLDAGTSGLLLWTDDGILAQELCRPAGGVWKRYHIELYTPLAAADEPRLTGGGIDLDGLPCRPARLRPNGPDRRCWIMEIHEGRKRQIRRMFAALGLDVVGLHRTAFGPILLGDLQPGEFRQLGAGDVSRLRSAAVDGDGMNLQGGR